MKTEGQFIIFSPVEFDFWLSQQKFDRVINVIQLHHTYNPNYDDFKDGEHYSTLKQGIVMQQVGEHEEDFDSLEAMKRYHVDHNHWQDIAQNISIFPDGMVAVCRPFDIPPAGIKGCNLNGICIECVGNFDKGGDIMNVSQRSSIITVVRSLLDKFGLKPSIDTITYHAFWDMVTGKCTNMNGTGKGSFKSCPGNFGFFGGNTADAMQLNFIPLL